MFVKHPMSENICKSELMCSPLVPACSTLYPVFRSGDRPVATIE